MSIAFPARAFVLLLVAALAHPAVAQFTEKDAVAQVKAAGKEQLKLFKQSGTAALATLDASLKAAEAALTESTTVSGLSGQVSSASIAFVVTMNDAYTDALDPSVASAALALDSLAAGGDLEGVFPKDLYYATGGALDDHRAALLKAAVKVRGAAAKRLAKTSAQAEKLAGIALAVVVQFPTVTHASTVNPNQTLVFTESLRLDVFLSASALDTANDGVLVLAGATDDHTQNATMGWDGPGFDTDSDSIAPVPITGRLTNTFTSLPEGGYVLWALQGLGSYEGVGAIGIR